MIYANLEKSSLNKNSRSIRNNLIGRHKKNEFDIQSSTMRVSKKLMNIYSQLSGKKIVIQFNQENHYENKYFEKFLMIEILNAYYSFFSIIS